MKPPYWLGYLTLGFFLLPSILAFGAGYGGTYSFRAGERCTVDFYVLNGQENDRDVYVTIDVLGVFDNEENPVNPHWFENFSIEPPLENLPLPGGGTVEANFFLPNLYGYRIWGQENVPTSIPENAENVFDAYIWAGNSWFPVKIVRVSFDISKEAYMGNYILKVVVTGAPLAGGQVSGRTATETKIRFSVSGRAPPPKPIPVLLTLIILVIVIAILVVLRPVLRKKRVKI